MSDLEAAAAALNAPEAIVRRSAEARAAASGATVDEVLAAWAGGGSAPAPAAAAAAPPAEAPAPPADDAGAEEAPAVQAPAAEPVATAPAAGTAPAAASAQGVATVAVAPPAAPPILEGRRERPFTVMLGAAGALLLALVAGLLAPSIPEPGTGVRTSEIAFSDTALEGRDIYRSLGCQGCHTQVVRAVVVDAGLGPVTLSDTNQEIGLRRHGPDLSDVGTRITDPGALTDIVTGAGGHPAYAGLSDEDLAALMAYLRATPPVSDPVGGSSAAPAEGDGAAGDETADGAGSEAEDGAASPSEPTESDS